MSDSTYASRIRHRGRHLQSTAGRPPSLDVIDDAWAAATLSDDDIDVERHEVALASILLDEEDDLLDSDAACAFSAAPHSGSAADVAAERRRKEEGRWNDLGLADFLADASVDSNNIGNNNQGSHAQGEGADRGNASRTNGAGS
jgi:hypothetical protein